MTEQRVCPQCGRTMADVTESWQTFVESEGAEYLAAYVSIWHCPSCGAVAGVGESGVEWVIDPVATGEEN